MRERIERRYIRQVMMCRMSDDKWKKKKKNRKLIRK